MTMHSLRTGAAVKGTYCGVAFTGTVASHRPHTMNHQIEMFTIDLEQPIEVFGSERIALCLHMSDDRAALDRFMGSVCTDTLEAR